MHTAAPPTFVARQPILDAQRGVFGYELLFRGSPSSDGFDGTAEAASASVITNAFLTVGIDALTQGRKAFINVTRALLLDDIAEILPPDRVVLELTEDIAADPDVLEACLRLRRAGYALALDDFVLTDRTAALIPHAAFIKVDFLGSDAAARAHIHAECRAHGPLLLAEKIETVEVFETALAEGYSYFQGYFFGRPVLQSGPPLPGQHVQSLRLLGALQDPNLPVHAIEELVKGDPRLCYLILRTVNSAGSGLRTTVRSIHDALVLLGRDTIRRWASLWILAGLGDSGHPELVSMSATRARSCELLGTRAAIDDGFLVGMCSLLDVITARPMTEIVEHLPLAESTRETLLGGDTLTRRLLDCVTAYERGDWTGSLLLAGHVGINPRHLPEAYADALRWTRRMRG